MGSACPWRFSLTRSSADSATASASATFPGRHGLQVIPKVPQQRLQRGAPPLIGGANHAGNLAGVGDAGTLEDRGSAKIARIDELVPRHVTFPHRISFGRQRLP
jgi:hypothetical protein